MQNNLIYSAKRERFVEKIIRAGIYIISFLNILGFSGILSFEKGSPLFFHVEFVYL